MTHRNSHPFAGLTVSLTRGINDPNGSYPVGTEYHLEDYADRINGRPIDWQNPRTFAELNYIRRSALDKQPLDENVVYGKIGSLGYLVHESEIS